MKINFFSYKAITEILDNLVTFGSVISVYPFPFFSNIINGNVYIQEFEEFKKIIKEKSKQVREF